MLETMYFKKLQHDYTDSFKPISIETNIQHKQDFTLVAILVQVVLLFLLNLPSLGERRFRSKSFVIYKILNNPIDIPTHYFIPHHLSLRNGYFTLNYLLDLTL